MNKILSILLILGLYCNCFGFNNAKNNHDLCSKLNIKPIVNSYHNTTILDFWITLSYNRYSDDISIKSRNIFEPYVLKNKTFDIGVGTELYSVQKGAKLGAELGYNRGRLIESTNTQAILLSHWVYIDLYLRNPIACIGVCNSFLINSSSKNAYTSGLFRYSDSYNSIVPILYIGLIQEFTRLRFEIKGGFGAPVLNPNKMFAADTNQHTLGPLYLKYKIAYKIFSTSKPHRFNWL